jgi:membrane protein implicated in regulation of membrane protease activity
MNTLYLVCFLVGLGLSVVSFVSGLDRITVFDHIFGHSHHAGGHHHARVGVKVAKNIPVTHVSPFNMAAMTAFLVWFGGAGVVIQQVTGWPAHFVAGGAMGAGVIGGSVVNRFLRVLMSGERPLESAPLIGTIGTVTSRIRSEGTGEIAFSSDGTRRSLAARSDTGVEIERSTEVVIIRYEKGIAYVSTWDELADLSTES